MDCQLEFIILILAQPFNDHLEALRLSLNADFAIVSSIFGHVYTILAVTSELELASVQVGKDFRCEDTYCDQVLRTQKTVIHTHINKVSNRILHPVYTAMQLESYIGEPLWKEGSVVATLNFSGFMHKKEGYLAESIEQVKSLARAIEAELRYG
jgi:GAF domain-containing protein